MTGKVQEIDTFEVQVYFGWGDNQKHIEVCHGAVVPRVGDTVQCWPDRDEPGLFGRVEKVHWVISSRVVFVLADLISAHDAY